MKQLVSRGENYTEMLPSFRSLILKLGVQADDAVIFSGCPGTCYSMATFLAFGIRDLGFKIYFAVNSDLNQLWHLDYVDHLGMVGANKVEPVQAQVIILMSGLMRVPLESTLRLVREALAPGGHIIGETVVPGLFEDSKWDQQIPFHGFFEFEMRNPASYLAIEEKKG